MKSLILTRIFQSFCVVLIGILTGCAAVNPFVHTKTVYREVPISGPKADVPPGVVEYVWEEPMVDVVDVPPGLDPEGRYYRPGHQAVVEVRQGRWRHYKLENN